MSTTRNGNEDAFDKGMNALERASFLLFVADEAQLLDHFEDTPHCRRKILAALEVTQMARNLVDQAFASLRDAGQIGSVA